MDIELAAGKQATGGAAGGDRKRDSLVALKAEESDDDEVEIIERVEPPKRARREEAGQRGLQEVEGDLLDFPIADYIAHQCNCITRSGKGLSEVRGGSVGSHPVTRTRGSGVMCQLCRGYHDAQSNAPYTLIILDMQAVLEAKRRVWVGRVGPILSREDRVACGSDVKASTILRPVMHVHLSPCICASTLEG